MFQTFIGITALAAMLSLVNNKLLKLPDTIGVMIIAIVISLGFAAVSTFAPDQISSICQVIEDNSAHLLIYYLKLMIS